MNQREIKFRAWNGGNMLYSQKGDFYLMSDNKVDVPSSTGHEFTSHSYPVMQYTGLKDKNGKEIYEGDIVQSQWSMNGEDMILENQVVVFKSGCFWETVGETPLYEFHEDIGVIGNIYEHPRLLTSQNV